MEVHSTKELLNLSTINGVIYGPSGIGKTVLGATAPSPLILSAEDGLLSIAGNDVDFVNITKLADLIEVYNFLKKSEHDYETVYLDSLSETSEIVLEAKKKGERDPRRAYGKMADEITPMIRKFKKLPMHCFFVTKQARIEDSFTGKQMFGPFIPGKVLPANLPYLVDLVLAMRMGKHEGKDYRYLQTSPDIQYEAKDRSGVLDLQEKPDLNYLINKILKQVAIEKEQSPQKQPPQPTEV